MRVPAELEQQLAEAAQRVMDLSRQAMALDPEALNAGAEAMMAGSMCLAVQSIFMADLLASPGESVSLEGDHLLGLYRGLGIGAGNCLGALENAQTRSTAFGIVVGACEKGLRRRVVDDAGDSARDMLDRILGGRP